MDKLLVTVAGAVVIGFIYWFFFRKREGAMEAKNSWDITVEGGYKPATITIPAGKTSTLTFTRKDSNSCLEEVVIEDFKIKKYLPLNEPVAITVSPTKPATHGIHCAMFMFHGKIIVA